VRVNTIEEWFRLETKKLKPMSPIKVFLMNLFFGGS